MSVELRIDRVLAPNPGLFTGPGTNTYIVGDDHEVLVLDPGPIDRGHERAILQSVGSRVVTAVVVTHTHPDHAPMANPLARNVEVPAYGYDSGPEFDPDVRLADGSVIEIARQPLGVVHTPGHSDDHLCFRLGSTLFTGDHIMGGSSVMVDDMGPYLDSLRRLSDTGLTRLLPGHGEQMDEPDEIISWYIAHRLDRERQIVDALWAGAATVGAVVESVYTDVDSALHPLAARSVVAHLKKLETDGVARRGGDGWDSATELLGASSPTAD